MLQCRSGAPLTVGVWGADKPARAAYTAALLAALNASALNASLDHEPDADLHFLLGLNAPGQDLMHDTDMPAADALLRQQLDDAGITYAVLHGEPALQVNKAMTAIERRLTADHAASYTVQAPASPPWVWPCEKCGDAGCEFRLLSSLLSERRTTP
jgi:putative intracellular protease/amidase